MTPVGLRQKISINHDITLPYIFNINLPHLSQAVTSSCLFNINFERPNQAVTLTC